MKTQIICLAVVTLLSHSAFAAQVRSIRPALQPKTSQNAETQVSDKPLLLLFAEEYEKHLKDPDGRTFEEFQRSFFGNPKGWDLAFTNREVHLINSIKECGTKLRIYNTVNKLALESIYTDVYTPNLYVLLQTLPKKCPTTGVVDTELDHSSLKTKTEADIEADFQRRKSRHRVIN